MSNKVYIGIDPGKNGAITVIDSEGKIEVHVMPTVGKIINVLELVNIISGAHSNRDIRLGTYCVIEDVHAIFGSSAGATFDFGYGLGLLEGVVTACGISYTKVAPKKWQSAMFEGVKLMQKPSSTGKTMKTDTKNMATVAAQRLFPSQDLRATVKCRTPHDGIVDSLLIAEYCRRNF